MKHRHAAAVVAVEPADGLGGQGDLRDQDDGLAALLQGQVNELHKNLGLAAAGDPKEQGGGAVLPVIDLPQGVCRSLLGWGQDDFLPGPGPQGVAVGVPVGFFQVVFPGTGLDKVIHHPLGDPGKVADLFHRGTAHPLEKLQNLLLLGGEKGVLPVLRQAHHLELLVLDTALEKVLLLDQPFFRQGFQGRVILSEAQGIQKVLLGGGGPSPAQVPEDLFLLRGEGGFVLPGPTAEDPGGLGLHAVAAGQEDLQGVEPGAEGLLLQPGQDAELLLVQDRLPVGRGKNRLELFGDRFPCGAGKLQNKAHSFGGAAPAKGDQDPLAGGEGHPVRDQVVVGLVEMVGSIFHNDLGNGGQGEPPPFV